MGVEYDIATALDGLEIGCESGEVICDHPHEGPQSVDVERRVQYECIRIDESISVFETFGVDCYDVWLPDLLRCSDCEIETLSTPTAGFDEALVDLDVTWNGTEYVLDTKELTVIAYSPRDEGEAPPSVPAPLVTPMIERGDPGGIRRSRIERMVPELRAEGAVELADVLDAELNR
ncbi:hypothetical protein [Natronomonas amylolytica]|uniref:hypothetical protein n=1 Tax=Natronomonas amylolytica TaxID=3108498 RepID=UPI0030081926